MGLVIRGGRLIDPRHGVDGEHTLYLDHGRVVAIDQLPVGFVSERIVEAAGLVVCPGLVDMRARLRDPGEEYKATMESETGAAVAGGVTTLCCPPDTFPVLDTPAMAHMVRNRAAGIGRSRIVPLGALTVGLNGERLTDMAALADAGCAGVGNAEHPVTNTLVMRRAMQYASTFGLTVFLNPQDPWLQGNGCVHEGIVSTRLGLPAIPEAAEIVGVARDLALVETTGARAHFCHLSSARAVAMIAEARTRGLPVSADVTAYHLHLTEHDIGTFDTRCFVLPPLRGTGDREALREALAGGIVSAVCSDHQPHGPDAKLAPFGEAAPGISGLETLLGLTLRLVRDGVLPLNDALRALTAEPAALLQIDAGHLGVGAAADVCIFDPDTEWSVEPDAMISRGHNTPFGGWRLPGTVLMTLVEGRIVYERGGEALAPAGAGTAA